MPNLPSTSTLPISTNNQINSTPTVFNAPQTQIL